MKEYSDLQKKMLQEIQNENLFNQARDFAIEYAEKAFNRNVYPTAKAIEDLEYFEEKLPLYTSEGLNILNQLHKYGSPATVSQIGGRYFGLVNGGIIPVALAVKWLGDFWDQNTPLFLTSPIASKLESVVEKWLIELFRLPEDTVAGFVSGTSMAILCGLAAARWRIYQRLDYDINAKGLIGAPKIRIIAGKEAHGAVLKAITLLGFGKGTIEWVDIDTQGRMQVEAIPDLDERSILILQAGNVNTGSFDNFSILCAKAKKANAWVHIDGAFGLWASGSNQLEYLTKGIEQADSWSVDGHKTLNTPYDCGIILCNDKEALVSSLQATGSYITYGDRRDGMLYTPEMSRRARIIELWATIKYLGKQGINTLVYGLHERAKEFADELQKHGFQIINDVVFNQILVCCENDEITQNTLVEVQESLECWCGGAVWNNRKVIRISVCSWATTSEDISRSVKSFVDAYEKSKKLE